MFNSAVCQLSEINFKVSGSNYYCSIYEPEPKDPGELGRKTVIGVDGNVNGVRDDVEIWINNMTTNSTSKDLNQVREKLYSVAKELQRAVIAKDDSNSTKKRYLNALKMASCVSRSTDKFISTLPNKMNVIAFNTKARLDAWIIINSKMKGTTSADLSTTCE